MRIDITLKCADKPLFRVDLAFKCANATDMGCQVAFERPDQTLEGINAASIGAQFSAHGDYRSICVAARR